ncbi:PREDICTED: uncharacterized protein LOC106792870 [Polistes canadensis]|uniref:uncharacterized protein LOC106792870 n=1 Tax=Polistes canadensis TaxID=91411 RepID=UPI000718C2A0|nr:PREDICTED: uncharacterized protein LOC106792870 [Polistes canadensis]
MNNLIICLVVAFCIVQISNVRGESLEVLKARLQQSKGNVNRLISDLERSKRNLEFDLGVKLSNTKINSMQSINDLTNPAMNEIRNAVNAAKEQGKNADHCLESGRLALREISLSSFASLDACVSNAKQGIVPAQNNMDATIGVARQMLTVLDSIFPDCYSNNIFQMQSCISLAIGKANGTIRSLQSTAENVKSSGNVASSNSYIKGNSCMSGIVSSARPKVPVAVNDAKACIESA